VNQSVKDNFNDFHQNIDTYVHHGGVSSKSQLYIFNLFPYLSFRLNAKRIVKSFERYLKSNKKGKEETFASTKVHIEPYGGQNRHVRMMIDYLQENLKEYLFGAYLHGSLGTYEEIPYSDFDALVIIKDNVLTDPNRLVNAAGRLYKAQSIMFDFDPLQHHGWFILTEADLIAYHQYFFPLELFDHAKLLLPDLGMNLTINIRHSADENKRGFEELSKSLIDFLRQRNYPSNLYQLKALLSGFMLLPALYVQARDSKGIYKKYSYKLAKVDFSEGEWSIMDEVSFLRANWSYNISWPQRFFFKRPQSVCRLSAKKFAPAIPQVMRKILTDDFYKRMAIFVVSMSIKLK